ncbi:hypothetical protein Daus18300_005369 [Diaporthe australafricana]|uniref:Uncharacterized protein n=1 Tax=Diaporthe australafricana TaxID=127596 RepID=A0ABR3X2I9_9PEZI
MLVQGQKAQFKPAALYLCLNYVVSPVRIAPVFFYEQVDLPFYEVYEESPSGDTASEDFNALRSVKQIELARGQPTYGSGMATTVWNNNYVFEVEDFNNLLSPVGPRRKFRTLADLQEEIRNLKQANQVD